MVRQQARVSHPPLASQERSGWPVGRAGRRSPRFQEGRRRTPTGGCGRVQVRRPGSRRMPPRAAADAGTRAQACRAGAGSSPRCSARAAPPESPKPPASSAGVNPYQLQQRQGLPRVSATIWSRTRAQRPGQRGVEQRGRPRAGPRPPAPRTPRTDRRRLATGGCERLPAGRTPVSSASTRTRTRTVGGPSEEPSRSGSLHGIGGSAGVGVLVLAHVLRPLLARQASPSGPGTQRPPGASPRTRFQRPRLATRTGHRRMRVRPARTTLADMPSNPPPRHRRA